MKKCPTCGTTSDGKFCPDCGTRLQDPVMDESPASDQIAVNESPAVREKKPGGAKWLIGFGAVVLVLIVIVSSIGAASLKDKSTDYSEETSSESSTDYSDDESSLDYSDDSESESYSNESDDGLDLIQGTWHLVGVTTDGESKYVDGESANATYEVSGNTYYASISTDTTVTDAGTLSFVNKYSDDGITYYVYDMYSNDKTGTVKMAYSVENEFIVVSTSEGLDPDNNLFFSK